MRKRRFKRIVTFGLAGVMVMAMITVGRAGYRGEQIEMGGYADCYISCDYSSATAQTTVYANYNAYYVMAYAEVELDARLGSGVAEAVGSNVNDTFVDYGGYASATAYIEEALDYNVGTYAWSYHDAEIDGESGSCTLSEQY